MSVFIKQHKRINCFVSGLNELPKKKLRELGKKENIISAERVRNEKRQLRKRVKEGKNVIRKNELYEPKKYFFPRPHKKTDKKLLRNGVKINCFIGGIINLPNKKLRELYVKKLITPQEI